MFKKWAFAALLCMLIFTACTRAAPVNVSQPKATEPVLQPVAPNARLIPTISASFLLPTRAPDEPAISPTPDKARVLPPIRTKPETYSVQPNDTLAKIAQDKGVSVNAIVQANEIQNADLLNVGQIITVPAPTPKAAGPSTKILPDSELVFGPVNAFFDPATYIEGLHGYLSQYSEDVAGEQYSGVAIVQRVSQEYSVNPRLLLALLEYRSGWLTQTNPQEGTLKYPLGWVDAYRPGLYRQMAWAANNLNRGFYLWRVNAISSFLLADGSVVPPSTTINAGTVGVENLLAQYFGYDDWLSAISEGGFIQTYRELFGDPFAVAVEPLLPDALKQPAFLLPFDPGQIWSFTGGPHGGWGDGSAWAAIDFAPPGDALGCVQNDAWVTAVAEGVILRADHGAVVEDLDGDGFEQTGWTVLYMHIETRDRIETGTVVKAGDRIGHPSCEGGVSNGTHTHIARRYNGEWIPADGSIPFNLEGWISSGYGSEYDGALRRDGQTIEAWADRRPENQIHR